ncbi:MAG: hypothetical protein QNJ32_18325 [Xenococcaceae cyanobacterium MO_167.B27]|nr:hypothetical protein [Xenococcaceae cyanobacterium MO_167.B27]
MIIKAREKNCCYAIALSYNTFMKVREVIKILEGDGWYLKRTRGKVIVSINIQ